MIRSRRLLVLPLVAAFTMATIPVVRGAGGDGDVVARIGQQVITLEEIDALAQAQSLQAYQQLFDARSNALNQMIVDKLLALEAASRGTSVEALVQTEVTAKVAPVTDAEVEKFYNDNSARMGGRPLDELRQPIRDRLEEQKRGPIRTALLQGLRTKYGVEVMLDAPRAQVGVAPDDPTRGPADAPVQLIAFSEFQCPYCARVGPTLTQVMTTYGDKVRLVFRDFPLPFHNNAHAAAEAAQCANEQGKFWEYHDKLFANQRALEGDKLKSYAAELGLDTAKFDGCFDSGKYKGSVEADHLEGQRYGVQGTPAFFINGRFLNGAQPFEAFKQIIDEELARKPRAAKG